MADNKKQTSHPQFPSPIYWVEYKKHVPRLSKIISALPTEYRTYRLNKWRIIKELNENIYRENTTSRLAFVFVGLLWLTIPTLIFLTNNKLEMPLSTYYDYIVSAILYIPPWLFFLYALLIPSKYLILDRINGNITYSQFFFWQKPITIAFDSCVAAITTLPSSAGLRYKIELWPDGKRKRGGTIITAAIAGDITEILEYWSLIVWYMDRNRPLPPSKEFDPYRHADFERRQREGFLPPLYRSYINIPEQTEEQQKIRNKIWKNVYK